MQLQMRYSKFCLKLTNKTINLIFQYVINSLMKMNLKANSLGHLTRSLNKKISHLVFLAMNLP